jgi:hypothetical protein
MQILHFVPADRTEFNFAAGRIAVFGINVLEIEDTGNAERKPRHDVVGIDDAPGGDGQLVESNPELDVADAWGGEGAGRGDIEFLFFLVFDNEERAEGRAQAVAGDDVGAVGTMLGRIFRAIGGVFEALVQLLELVAEGADEFLGIEAFWSAPSVRRCWTTFSVL